MYEHEIDPTFQHPESDIHLSGFPLPDCSQFVERTAERARKAAHIAQLALTRVEAFLGDLPGSLRRQ